MSQIESYARVGIEVDPESRTKDDPYMNAISKSANGLPGQSIDWKVRPEQQIIESLQTGTNYFDTIMHVADVAGWSDEQLFGELLMWKRACDDGSGVTPERQVAEKPQSSWLDEFNKKPFLKFCRNFVERAQSRLNEMSDVMDEDSMMRASQELAMQRESLGDDAFRDLVIMDLRDSLEGVRYMDVLENVWLLGTRDLLEPLISEEVTGRPFVLTHHSAISILTFEAVAAALFCRRIGGCSQKNPILFQLCTVSRERPCLRPRNVFDAVDQILTGFERMHFQHYLNQIEMLLVEKST